MTDPSVCFYMGLYQEWDEAQQQLSNLRHFHPTADILAVTDGTDNPDFADWCHAQTIRYVADTRLKPIAQGAAWIVRMIFLYTTTSDAPVLVKLDPDSQINRSITSYPQHFDLFGSFCDTQRGTHLNGSALGMTRSAALKIWRSALLHDPLYTSPAFGYLRYQPPYLRPGEERSAERLVAVDIVLNHIAQRLKLKLGNWDEVCAYTFPEELQQAIAGMTLAEVTRRYAIVHPARALFPSPLSC